MIRYLQASFDLNFNIQRALGCDYNYRYFGLTGIEFLEKLRDHLKA